MPLAATVTTERIFEAFLGRPEEFRAFYYGHTYTGNPLAAATAMANLEIFRDEQVIERIQPMIERACGKRWIRALLAIHKVADIRQWGLMAGVEIMESPARPEGFSLCRANRSAYRQSRAQGRRAGPSVG